MENMNTPTKSKESLSTPPMSSLTPLQLSGFHAGDTIRVHCNTGELRFSVQLNVNKNLFSENPASPLDDLPDQASSFSYSYVTPIASPPTINEGIDSCHLLLRERVVTRLKSGVISPVKYFPRGVFLATQVTETAKKRKRKRKIDLFERLRRKRSCPVRPCSSYAFFVMANWGDVNSESCSFGETSKRVGQIWAELSCKEKKVYETMALKDSERYKWQSELFREKGERYA